MLRTIIFLSAILALGGTALAADLPPSPPPGAPAAYVSALLPVYNWAGVYVGINGGWGRGNAKWTATPLAAFQEQAAHPTIMAALSAARSA